MQVRSYRELLDRMRRFAQHDVSCWLNSEDKKPLLVQAREVRQLWSSYGAFPAQYFKHDLYLREVGERYRDYVPNPLADAFVQATNPQSARAAIDNKSEFEAIFTKAGFPIIAALATAVRVADGYRLERCGRVLATDELRCMARQLGHTSLFVKPMSSSQGSGSARIDIKDHGLEQNGRPIDCDGLQQLLQSFGYSDYLIQPFVVQHDCLNAIYSGSVNTARVIVVNTSTGPVVSNAVLRLGIEPCNLDAWSQGGLAVGIDLDSGALHATAIGKCDYYGTGRRMDRHPDSEVVFRNQVLPYWQEARKLVTDASKLLPGLSVIGWDVAFGRDGPLLIEANSNPEMMLTQAGAGLRNSPLGDKMACHYRWRAPQ